MTHTQPTYGACTCDEYSDWYTFRSVDSRKNKYHESWMDLPQEQIAVMVEKHNAIALEQGRVMAIQGCKFSCYNCGKRIACYAEFPEAHQ